MSNSLKTIIFSLLILSTFGLSAVNDSVQSESVMDQRQQPRNPNGDSELALLMRAMFDEAVLLKEQIENGDSLTFSLDQDKILTAIATDPEQAASSEFKALGNAYLSAVYNLADASDAERMASFDNVVNNCLACHQMMCPGPIVVIKKLQ